MKHFDSKKKSFDSISFITFNFFLQIQKISFVSEGTCEPVPGLLAADVNKQKQILARIEVNDRFFIRVLDIFARTEVSSVISSDCNHRSSCIITHPSYSHFVLEGCDLCGLIRNYNIHTEECSIVYTGWRPGRICHGPTSCILVQDGCFFSQSPAVFKLKWEKEERQLYIDHVCIKDGMIQKLCYVESLNILVTISCHKEIKAVKLDSNNPVWKLSGEVSGHVIKPDALTTDAEGNIYVSDGANNRILTINALTGNVMSILLLAEEGKGPIRSLFWSDTEPNLTMIRKDKISTYNIPKPD